MIKYIEDMPNILYQTVISEAHMDGMIHYDRRSFPQAGYVILYVSVFLAFVVGGAFSGRMFYSAVDAESVIITHLPIRSGDFGKSLLGFARTEIPTAVEMIIVFLAPLTLIPTAVRSAVIAYRGAALGWSVTVLPLCTGTYAVLSVGCYAAASAIILIFAAESSVKTPESGGVNGKIRYLAGFLVMSAAVFAVELLPTVSG